MRINLTKKVLSNLLMTVALFVFVANVVVLIDYVVIKRPVIKFQNEFHNRQDKFTDSLKGIDSDNGVVCVVFWKSSPYLFINLDVTDSNFNDQTSKDLFAAAKRDLLSGTSCREVVVLLRNGLKFVKHTFDMVKGTDSFSEVKDGQIAKWCIADSCLTTN